MENHHRRRGINQSLMQMISLSDRHISWTERVEPLYWQGKVGLHTYQDECFHCELDDSRQQWLMLFPLQSGQCRYNVALRARSLNYCCCGKVLSVTYSECVFVALAIRRAIGTRRGLSGCAIFFSQIISKMARFKKKLLFLQLCLKYFSI